jgi:hypothetical protein
MMVTRKFICDHSALEIFGGLAGLSSRLILLVFKRKFFFFATIVWL